MSESLTPQEFQKEKYLKHGCLQPNCQCKGDVILHVAFLETHVLVLREMLSDSLNKADKLYWENRNYRDLLGFKPEE